LATDDKGKSSGWDRPDDYRPARRHGQRSRKLARREELLHDFYGEELGPEMVESRQPRAFSLGDALKAALPEVNLGSHVLLRELLESWDAVAGYDYAQQCRPQRIQGHTLFVEVAKPAWMFRLRGQPLRIMTERVRERSQGKVQQLQLVAAGRIR